MKHKCTVPKDATTDSTGNFHYVLCGKPAKYKAEGWYLCEGCKKYVADIEKWPTELLEED